MIISLIRLVNVCLRNMSGFQIVLKRKQNIWFCSELKRFDTLCLQNNLFSEFCDTSKWYFFLGGGRFGLLWFLLLILSCIC